MLFGTIDVSKRVVTRSDLSFAFMAKMPILPGHVLVCPLRVVERMEELSRDELCDLHSLVAGVKRGLVKKFAGTGFNTAWNEGEMAGQTVPHLHVHIVPRSENDGGIVDYEPRKFLYRPGVRDCSPEEELISVAKSLANLIVR